MPGDPDPQYVRARSTLLDATDALAARIHGRVLRVLRAYRVTCRHPRCTADCLRLLPQKVTGESGPGGTALPV